MNVEQPGIMIRPKRVNAEATRFLPRRTKDVKQRVFNCLLITGAHQTGQRRTSPRRLLSGRSNAQPGNAETLPSNSVGTLSRETRVDQPYPYGDGNITSSTVTSFCRPPLLDSSTPLTD